MRGAIIRGRNCVICSFLGPEYSPLIIPHWAKRMAEIMIEFSNIGAHMGYKN